MNSKPGKQASPGLADASSEISPASPPRPIPPAYKYIQVNGCKTPGCENFGVPPREGPIIKGRGAASADGYTVTGGVLCTLRCQRCGKNSRLKNNKAIYQEQQRQGSFLWAETPLRCPDETCANHHPDPRSDVRQFRKYGKTRHGSDRWQCCACKKTFSLGKPTLRQQKPHVNHLAFNLLLNKVPINRMMEILDVDARTIYRKIDFIYEQCRLFAASREMKLRHLRFERLYLATDRQDYIVNWGDRSVRRTIQLTAIATADLRSGYLFGMTPNFDMTLTPDELEAICEKAGNSSLPFAMRETARLWTAQDYRISVSRSPGGDEPYTARDDLDAPEGLDLRYQLPSSGVQVHADYLMHGHYWLLSYLLCDVGKLRFFLDGDAGLLNACMGAFSDRIRDRRADVIVVDIRKQLPTTERHALFGKAKAWYEKQLALYPDLKPWQVREKLMAERIAAVRLRSPDPKRALQQTWIEHPFPDLAEPVKRFRYVTDYGDYDDGHTANLLNLATLWPMDTIFNRIRRRITYCERPIRSNRRKNGSWQIYAPYDPAMIEKLLFIFRVWHNFVWVSPKTKKTAAELIGLAAGKIRTQDILYFDVRSAIG